MLGLVQLAFQDVHLALQGLVLLGSGAGVQLQYEGGILLGQHICLVLALGLPPGCLPAAEEEACKCYPAIRLIELYSGSLPPCSRRSRL